MYCNIYLFLYREDNIEYVSYKVKNKISSQTQKGFINALLTILSCTPIDTCVVEVGNADYLNFKHIQKLSSKHISSYSKNFA